MKKLVLYSTSLLIGVLFAFAWLYVKPQEKHPQFDYQAQPMELNCPDQFLQRRQLIDAHVHLMPLPESIERARNIFECAGIKKWISFNAGSVVQRKFWAHVELAKRLPGKYYFFCNIFWNDLHHPDFIERTINRLRLAVKHGAIGLKVFKNFGLSLKNKDGTLVQVDDVRFDPIWREAGKLGIPVAFHTADPVAFFEPITADNERYAELSIAPQWSFYGEQYPSHDDLLRQRNQIIARHPKTQFIGVHMANYPENIDVVSNWLEQYPNLRVNIAARVPELGRHPPWKLREFFMRYADRIYFGSDIIISAYHLQLGSVSRRNMLTDADALEFYRDHYRFLEDCVSGIKHPTPIQGEWMISALCLPACVLKKIYWQNAERYLLPVVAK